MNDLNLGPQFYGNMHHARISHIITYLLKKIISWKVLHSILIIKLNEQVDMHEW